MSRYFKAQAVNGSVVSALGLAPEQRPGRHDLNAIGEHLSGKLQMFIPYRVKLPWQ